MPEFVPPYTEEQLHACWQTMREEVGRYSSTTQSRLEEDSDQPISIARVLNWFRIVLRSGQIHPSSDQPHLHLLYFKMTLPCDPIGL